MKLYLVRHAIAEERGTPGYEEDSLRPLTDKGRRKMRQIAKGLYALGVEFDLILSSPYLRARETAEILADVFKLKEKVIFSESLVPELEPEKVLAEINESHSAGSLALVGHEPHLSSLIGLLASGSINIDITLKKGGVCHLTADDPPHARRATLEWLLTPGILVSIAGK